MIKGTLFVRFLFFMIEEDRKGAGGNTMKKKIGVPIRVQMFGGFLVSILFIILVGSISYQKAADSLTANYTSSTRNTIRMTVTSLDDSLKNVQNALSELSQDANVKSYALGGLKNNVSAQQSTRKLLNNNIMVKQTATDMIYSINIITVDDEQFLTTQRMDATGDDSFLSELEQSKDGYLLEKNGIYWGSTHPFLGEKLMTEESAYPLFCSRTVSSGDITALVVIDVSSEAILQLLEQLDMGEGSQISFISEGGKEIKNGDVTDISQSEFFLNNRDNITEDGFAEYVTYDGKSYYFMMEDCKLAGGYICAIVPRNIITKGSEDIRKITIMLVMIASVLALAVGSLLIRKIGRGIGENVKSLERVSKGELICVSKEKKQQNNEFGKLSEAIYVTVHRMRDLVETVKNMIEEVSDAGKRVSDSSTDVGLAVEDMTVRIDNIYQTIQKEDEEIESCSRQMEELSTDIKKVSGNISEIMQEIEQSEQIIGNGMDMVKTMSRQSVDTKEVTEEVAVQVNCLENRMEEIAHFVETIEAIAEETNLLSLNASIEAARAGENGRGFSVVAEEIRKLADSSAVTAKTIQQVIAEVRIFSQGAVAKVHDAEGIADQQVTYATDTEQAFIHVSNFMDKLADHLDELSTETKQMNQKRHEAVRAVQSIGKLSVGTIKSANEVNESLQKQISCTGELEAEAAKLKENMELLNLAVASFKLE